MSSFLSSASSALSSSADALTTKWLLAAEKLYNLLGLSKKEFEFPTDTLRNTPTIVSIIEAHAGIHPEILVSSIDTMKPNNTLLHTYRRILSLLQAPLGSCTLSTDGAHFPLARADTLMTSSKLLHNLMGETGPLKETNFQNNANLMNAIIANQYASKTGSKPRKILYSRHLEGTIHELIESNIPPSTDAFKRNVEATKKSQFRYPLEDRIFGFSTEIDSQGEIILNNPLSWLNILKSKKPANIQTLYMATQRLSGDKTSGCFIIAFIKKIPAPPEQVTGMLNINSIADWSKATTIMGIDIYKRLKPEKIERISKELLRARIAVDNMLIDFYEGIYGHQQRYIGFDVDGNIITASTLSLMVYQMIMCNCFDQVMRTGDYQIEGFLEKQNSSSSSSSPNRLCDLPEFFEQNRNSSRILTINNACGAVDTNYVPGFDSLSVTNKVKLMTEFLDGYKQFSDAASQSQDSSQKEFNAAVEEQQRHGVTFNFIDNKNYSKTLKRLEEIDEILEQKKHEIQSFETEQQLKLAQLATQHRQLAQLPGSGMGMGMGMGMPRSRINKSGEAVEDPFNKSAAAAFEVTAEDPGEEVNPTFGKSAAPSVRMGDTYSKLAAPEVSADSLVMKSSVPVELYRPPPKFPVNSFNFNPNSNSNFNFNSNSNSNQFASKPQMNQAFIVDPNIERWAQQKELATQFVNDGKSGRQLAELASKKGTATRTQEGYNQLKNLLTPDEIRDGWDVAGQSRLKEFEKAKKEQAAARLAIGIKRRIDQNKSKKVSKIDELGGGSKRSKTRKYKRRQQQTKKNPKKKRTVNKRQQNKKRRTVKH